MHFLLAVAYSLLKIQYTGKDLNKESDKKKKIRTGVSGVLEGSRGNRPGGLLLV